MKKSWKDDISDWREHYRSPTTSHSCDVPLGCAGAMKQVGNKYPCTTASVGQHHIGYLPPDQSLGPGCD